MIPSRYDLEIYRGDTYNLFMILQGFEQLPINISNCTFRMHIRNNETDELLESISTSNNKIFIVDPIEGKISIELTAETTTLYNWKLGKYDLELTYVNGTVQTLLYGVVKIIMDVTR